MVCFLFAGTPTKADYCSEHGKKYDKFNPMVVSDLSDLEQAIKSKASAVRISDEVNPLNVTPKDFERLGKSSPLKCLIIYSRAPEYEDGRYLRFMPRLQVLEMNACSPEAIASIPNATPLKKFSSNEGFSSKSLRNMAKLTQLEELYLRNCQISDEDLKYLQGLRKLKVLDLCGSNITGAGLKYLAKCPQLKYLDLSSNKQLGDAAMDNLKYFPDLRFLDIGDTAIGDAGFQHIAQLKKLEKIMFGDTKVDDGGMVALANLGELGDVSFGRDNVTDTGMQYLTSCKKLASIDASETSITDKSMTSLVSLPRLGSLNLESTKITDKSLPLFIKMKALNWLNVDETEFSGAALAELKGNKKPKVKPVLGPAHLKSDPVLCGNSVALALDSSEILCLDKSSGRQLWNINRSYSFMTPFKKNLICVGSYPRVTVTALRADTGQTIWEYVHSPIAEEANSSSARPFLAQTDAENLFLFCNNGRIVCLDLESGKVSWDKSHSSLWLRGSSWGRIVRESAEVAQDSANLYLRASAEPWSNGADTSFLIAINKKTGSEVWRSAPLFKQTERLQVETLSKSNCVLLISTPSSQQDEGGPHHLFVLDKNTGKLLKEDSIPRIKFDNFFTTLKYSLKYFSMLPEDRLCYIEPVEPNSGRFSTFHVERTPSSTNIVFDSAKSPVFLRPGLVRLMKGGLLVYGDGTFALLNVDDLKPAFVLKKEPNNFSAQVMAAASIKNMNQALVSQYHSKESGTPYSVVNSIAQIVSVRIPDGEPLFTLFPSGIGNYAYDNDANLLFLSDSKDKFYCWSFEAAQPKQRWMVAMPQRPLQRYPLCGRAYSQYARHSLTR